MLQQIENCLQIKVLCMWVEAFKSLTTDHEKCSLINLTIGIKHFDTTYIES